MKDIFILIRPHQYVKNFFILLPLFFAKQITELALLMNAFVAFAAFSMSASAIYILNDYHDIEADRCHPEKRQRPLTSGTVSKKFAVFLMGLFVSAGISLMAMLSSQATAILGIYVALNLGYTFYFKHIAILDIATIAIGFVLRLFIGSTVTDIPLSKWIVIMTFLLALFMALGKRRDDLLIFLNGGQKVRQVIDGYNLKLIDGAMIIMASVVIVAYILYTTSADVVQRFQNQYLYITAFFVILGIMRYLQIVFVEENSGSPTKIILKDKFMQITILTWILSFVWIIYL
ncbi:decaprenyl-phosphate phosphoribosyltransferase [Candidatus Magnetomoraceae bacterium gMMP-15]